MCGCNYFFKVAKELSHRAEELKQLGWNQEDLFKYIELWDYRQRWGAINLEREDRQFLRKAESLLPAISKAKTSVKKPLKEKSYYRWLTCFLEEMNSFEVNESLEMGMKGVWPILLEEELRALDYFEPVLGLPDTIKAKLIGSMREDLVKIAIEKFANMTTFKKFDFEGVLTRAKLNDGNTSWRSLREENHDTSQNYPILKESCVVEFRGMVSETLFTFIRDNFPSLSETDKPLPTNEWNQ